MAMEGAGAGLSLRKTALVTEPVTFHTVPQDSSGNISAGNLVVGPVKWILKPTGGERIVQQCKLLFAPCRFAEAIGFVQGLFYPDL